MANIKSSIKRIQVAQRNQEKNRSRRSAYKTAIKHFERAVEENNLEDAEKYLKLSEKLLRQAQHKNILHPNKVNRKVGQLTRAYNDLRA